MSWKVQMYMYESFGAFLRFPLLLMNSENIKKFRLHIKFFCKEKKKEGFYTYVFFFRLRTQ